MTVSLETDAHPAVVDVVVTLVTSFTGLKFTELVFPPKSVHGPPLTLAFQAMVPPLWPLNGTVNNPPGHTLPPVNVPAMGGVPTKT